MLCWLVGARPPVTFCWLERIWLLGLPHKLAGSGRGGLAGHVTRRGVVRGAAMHHSC